MIDTIRFMVGFGRFVCMELLWAWYDGIIVVCYGLCTPYDIDYGNIVVCNIKAHCYRKSWVFYRVSNFVMAYAVDLDQLLLDLIICLLDLWPDDLLFGYILLDTSWMPVQCYGL